jgi:hypothetical protein
VPRLRGAGRVGTTVRRAALLGSLGVLLAPALSAVSVLAVLPPEVPVVTNCWLQPRYFWSFTSGTVDYCRGHLAYTPGAFDCYRYGEQVCSIWLPVELSWTESRQPVIPPIIFPCPDAPQPPVCPRTGW